MILRPYRAADTDALAALWLAASRGVHGFLGDAELRRQQVLVAEQYLPGAETWVAEGEGAEGGHLGFIGLLDDFIGGLFVAPAAQGRGVVGRWSSTRSRARAGSRWRSTGPTPPRAPSIPGSVSSRPAGVQPTTSANPSR